MSVNRVRATSTLGLLFVAAAFRTLAQQGSPATPVRTDISGEWINVTSEDQPHYAPGPELGDYTGLPINAAARQKVEAWDATILSQPERQTQPHPVQYRNSSGRRIMKVLDPVTQQLVAYTIAGHFGRADQVVWMDGRPHPSIFAVHTWDGFSTGVWEDGVLVVTTTHMKMGFIRRNGVPASPYGKLVERFFRHGLYMTVFAKLEDPIFLEESYVRTYTWAWNPDGNMVAGDAFEAVDELSNRSLGWVPFFPLGTKHPEFAQHFGLPFEVTQGGAETMYPEYQLKVRQLMKEAAAKKAVTAANDAPAGTASAKDSLFGTWILDPVRSRFSNAQVDERTMTFEAAPGGAITHKMQTVRPDATNSTPVSYEIAYTAKFDGKDYPAANGSLFDTVSLKQINANTVERIGKIRGQTVETATWKLSADGNTLTITTKGTPPDAAEYSSLQVFNRK